MRGVLRMEGTYTISQMFQQVIDTYKSIPIEGLYGMIAFVIVIIFEVIVVKKFSIGNRRKLNIEKAEAAGHVHKGIRISLEKGTYRRKRGQEHRHKIHYRAVYEYKYNGGTYKKRIFSDNGEPPLKLDFYYKTNPKKVFTKIKKKTAYVNFVLMTLPLIAAFLVVWFSS